VTGNATTQKLAWSGLLAHTDEKIVTVVLRALPPIRLRRSTLPDVSDPFGGTVAEPAR